MLHLLPWPGTSPDRSTAWLRLGWPCRAITAPLKLLVLSCSLMLAVARAAPAVTPAPDQFLPAVAVQRCAPALASAPVAALRSRATALLASRAVARPATWADAVLTALCASQLPPNAEHASLVFALIETESSFNPHGLLPNHPEGFRKLGHRLIRDLLAGEVTELEQQMGKEPAARVLLAATSKLNQLGLLRDAPLRALFDRTYQRFGWQRVTTEWDIETTVTRDLLILAEEAGPLGLLLRAVLAVAPDWRQRLVDGAVLNSVGPLQVGPAAAVQLAAEDGLVIDELQARALLYTTGGGVYYGVRQLALHVRANTHHRPLSPAVSAFITADRWLGVLACRDAAVIRQVARLAGRELPPDTRLRTPAVRPLLLALQSDLLLPEQRSDMPADASARSHAQAVDRFLALAHHPHLEQDPLYRRIRAAYQRRFGQQPPQGLVPERRHYSAKTGSYRVAQVADDVRQRFVRNCIRLGCAPL